MLFLNTNIAELKKKKKQKICLKNQVFVTKIEVLEYYLDEFQGKIKTTEISCFTGFPR